MNFTLKYSKDHFGILSQNIQTHFRVLRHSNMFKPSNTFLNILEYSNIFPSVIYRAKTLTKVKHNFSESESSQGERSLFAKMKRT